MAYTYEQIIEIAQRSGIPNHPSSMLRPGAKTKSGNVSWHASGKAVDFGGRNQDALATLFMGIPTLEVFHFSDATGKWYGSSKGRPVDPATHQDLVQEHRDHLHVAMSEEQLGPGSLLDQMRKGLAAIGPGLGAVGGTLAGIIPNPGNVTEALANVGAGMHSIAQSALSVGQLAQLATKLFLPTTAIRVFAGFMGAIFILIGIWFLSREIRESKA